MAHSAASVWGRELSNRVVMTERGRGDEKVSPCRLQRAAVKIRGDAGRSLRKCKRVGEWERASRRVQDGAEPQERMSRNTAEMVVDSMFWLRQVQ